MGLDGEANEEVVGMRGGGKRGLVCIGGGEEEVWGREERVGLDGGSEGEGNRL